ncbi:LysR family transcriptional regulator [Bordetella avium]|uniref:LysR substrate-binding domain-containing protein n=1 Tax=Bordetella avium TaxID=521 RepID=UPI000FD95C0F|nr:LysR substrate-binding domain-containing protein [Bordetella avium]AZY50207.1 LysR family transcriptional regulator [Bordetella avium]
MIFLRKFTPSMSQLLAFEAAARLGSFTAAAKALFLTQSAVSRHIQELESLLQVDLFVRSGRRVSLSAEGARYAHEISGALARIRSASMDIYEARQRAGALQLAVLPIFGSKWLMPRLGDFQAKHPEVLINLHSRIGDIERTSQGVDACIIIGDGNWPRMESHHLLTARGVIIAAPSLLAKQPLQQAQDLRRHRLLEASTSAPGWRECLLASNLDPRIATVGSRFEYTAHLIQAVAGGLGLGLATDLFVQDELRAGTLVAPQLPGFRFPAKHYYLVHRPEKSQLPALNTFKTWLLSTAALARIETTAG